jgi:hypothetical protein
MEVRVSDIQVLNFFPPSITVVYPNGGEVIGPDPVNISWEVSDVNTDETLLSSIEVSNDSGQNWKTIRQNTRVQYLQWDPTDQFWSYPPGNQFLLRVTVTDGLFTVNDTSDGIFTVIDKITTTTTTGTRTTTSTTTTSEAASFPLFSLIFITLILEIQYRKRRI